MRLRLPFPAVLALAVAALVGCSRFQPPAVFDLESVNVASLPPDWPEEVELTLAQEEVLAARGEPDYLRARWDRRGGLTWGDELRTTYRRQRVIDIMAHHYHYDQPMPFDLSWIYQAEDQSGFHRSEDEVFRGEEIVFVDDDRWEVEEISDQIGVILDHGDPEARRMPETWNDRLVESWVYYHDGLIFHFLDGQITHVERTAPTTIRILPEI